MSGVSSDKGSDLPEDSTEESEDSFQRKTNLDAKRISEECAERLKSSILGQPLSTLTNSNCSLSLDYMCTNSMNPWYVLERKFSYPTPKEFEGIRSWQYGNVPYRRLMVENNEPNINPRSRQSWRKVEFPCQRSPTPRPTTPYNLLNENTHDQYHRPPTLNQRQYTVPFYRSDEVRLNRSPTPIPTSPPARFLRHTHEYKPSPLSLTQTSDLVPAYMNDENPCHRSPTPIPTSSPVMFSDHTHDLTPMLPDRKTSAFVPVYMDDENPYHRSPTPDPMHSTSPILYSRHTYELDCVSPAHNIKQASVSKAVYNNDDAYDVTPIPSFERFGLSDDSDIDDETAADTNADGKIQKKNNGKKRKPEKPAVERIVIQPAANNAVDTTDINNNADIELKKSVSPKISVTDLKESPLPRGRPTEVLGFKDKVASMKDRLTRRGGSNGRDKMDCKKDKSGSTEKKSSDKKAKKRNRFTQFILRGLKKDDTAKKVEKKNLGKLTKADVAMWLSSVNAVQGISPEIPASKCHGMAQLSNISLEEEILSQEVLSHETLERQYSPVAEKKGIRKFFSRVGKFFCRG